MISIEVNHRLGIKKHRFKSKVFYRIDSRPSRRIFFFDLSNLQKSRFVHSFLLKGFRAMSNQNVKTSHHQKSVCDTFMTLVTFLKLTLLCDTISSSALFSKVESKSICKEEECHVTLQTL